MEKKQENQAQATQEVIQPIIKPTETVEFLMSPIGQELKKMEMTQQLARTYSMSSVVPQRYQGNAGLANAYIAVDMAMRLGANPLLVMQNLYIVHGNPGWSAKFLIATFNQCGRFSSIQYETKGTPNTDDWGMRAYAYAKNDTEQKNPMYGTWIDIKMAKAEGWYNQNPKWRNIPEQMLRYRSAAWFVNTIAPEISMGISTVDEIEDSKTPIPVDAEYEDVTPKPTRVASFENPKTEPKPEAKPEEGASTQPEAKPEEAPRAATKDDLFG